MNWEYEPISRHVVYSEAGGEMAEIVEDIEGQNCCGAWRVIVDDSLVGRRETMQAAKELAETCLKRRGLTVMAGKSDARRKARFAGEIGRTEA